MGPLGGGLDGRDHVAHVGHADAQVIELADLIADAVLGVQRAVQDRPAVVDLAEPVPVGDADIGVVGEVGPLVADGGQRLDLDAWGVHGDQEHGQALVLGQGRVGPGDQEDVRGVLGAGGEDLLPVDDPFVAVAHGPGLGVGDVGPAVGLGVAQDEPGGSVGHLGLEFRLEVRYSVGIDGRPDQVVRAPGHGRVPLAQLGLKNPDADVVELGAAVFFLPPRLQPALGAQGQPEALVEVVGPLAGPGVHLLGQVLIQERPDLVAELLLSFSESNGREVHFQLLTSETLRIRAYAYVILSGAARQGSLRRAAGNKGPHLPPVPAAGTRLPGWRAGDGAWAAGCAAAHAAAAAPPVIRRWVLRR